MMLISGRLIVVSAGVERGRLTGAGRAGDEQGAGRARDHVGEPGAHLVGEAELLERRGAARLVEQTHDDLLALDGRQGRDADVEHAAGGGGVERDAAVLRLPPLGDVELREHLQARRHAGRHPLRDPLHLLEHAVDAEADDERVLLRLEVDVGGAVLGGLEDDRVDEPDERRVGDAVVDLEVVRLLLLGDPQLLVDLLEDSAGAERLGGARHPAQLDEDVLARGDAEVERVARREPELVDPVQVARIGDGDPQRAVVERVRDRDDALEDVQRDLLGRVLVDAREREVDERDLIADGERARDSLGRRDALVDDRLRERALAGAPSDHRELVLRDETGRREQVDDELGHRVHAHAGAERFRAGRAGVPGAAGLAKLRWRVAGHIPRSSYRQRRGIP